MQIRVEDLREAVSQGILTSDQADALWTHLGCKNRDAPTFSFTHILYYFGGLIAIGAMSLFITVGWQMFGGWGLFAIAATYAAVAIGVTEFLLARRLLIPAGITAALAVTLVPLAVYGVQLGLGLFDQERVYRDYHYYVDWRWLVMELATLVAAVLLLARYRLPFLLMPVAVTLWYMSMDLAPWLYAKFHDQSTLTDQWTYASWQFRCWVSLGFGLMMIVLAIVADFYSQPRRDFAFWLYLFGVLAFWGGLSSMEGGTELTKLIYAGINLGLIIIGAVLYRRVFVVFGGLGVAGYLGHLSYSVFRDSLAFPFALTLIGLAIVALGIYWQRHEARIIGQCQSLLPAGMRRMIERRS